MYLFIVCKLIAKHPRGQYLRLGTARDASGTVPADCEIRPRLSDGGTCHNWLFRYIHLLTFGLLAPQLHIAVLLH
jgi:hypothetical protein